jgi:hypothetical protein
MENQPTPKIPANVAAYLIKTQAPIITFSHKSGKTKFKKWCDEILEKGGELSPHLQNFFSRNTGELIGAAIVLSPIILLFTIAYTGRGL